MSFQKSYDSSNSDDDDEEMEDEAVFNQKTHVQQILWATLKGKEEIVATLLDKDPNLVNCTDSDQYTPLHRAAYTNQPHLLKLLLKRGASVSSVTIDGWTALHSAAKWNSYECVALLLDEGANVSAQTNSGQTPLHLAALNREAKETMQMLLLHPLYDSSIKNSSGETAKQIAERCGPFGFMFGYNDKLFNPFEMDD